MMWFENGRVSLFVRNPASKVKAKKLFCNGFFETGLIFEIRHVDEIFKSFMFGGAHYVYESGKPLPKMTINTFGRSHGIVIKTGDKSHPRAVEVISGCPDWAERSELLLGKLADLLDVGTSSKGPVKKPDYVV